MIANIDRGRTSGTTSAKTTTLHTGPGQEVSSPMASSTKPYSQGVLPAPVCGRPCTISNRGQARHLTLVSSQVASTIEQHSRLVASTVRLGNGRHGGAVLQRAHPEDEDTEGYPAGDAELAQRHAAMGRVALRRPVAHRAPDDAPCRRRSSEGVQIYTYVAGCSHVLGNREALAGRARMGGAGQWAHDGGSRVYSLKGVTVQMLGARRTEGLADEEGHCGARGGQVGHAQQLQVQRQERQRIAWDAACTSSTRALGSHVHTRIEDAAVDMLWF